MKLREPDFVIGGTEDPYLRRWHLIPRNRWFNVYLHQFLRSDADISLHDHPWTNLSILLRGSYVEHMPMDGRKVRKPWRPWAPWRLVLRRAEAAHRVELLGWPFDEKPVWSLFITGPRTREWGFWCGDRWVHWRDFTNAKDGGATVGKGCAE